MARNKGRKYIVNFILCFFAILLFSCNNWERDVSNVTVDDSQKLAEIELEGAVISSGFPKNITAMFFLNEGVVLVGTSDGQFYKSKDDGKTWTKTGEMSDKAKINCITGQNDNSGNLNIIAATDKGGYVSSDEGSSWKETLKAKNESGSYRVLTYGTVNSSGYTFYGEDGTNNSFNYSSILYTWNNVKADVHIPGGLLAGNIYDCSASYTLRGYNNENKSAIVGLHNNIWETFDDNLNISVTLTLKNASGNYRYLLGTKNGFRISTDYGATWNKTSLEGRKINCAIYYMSGSMLFAGTEQGIYMSCDYGENWTEIKISDVSKSIKYMFLNNSKVYFVTDAGGTYYFKIPSDYGEKEFVPVPFLPLNNSSLSSAPFLQWSRTNDANKVEYRLQISDDSLFDRVVIDTITRNSKYQTSFNKKGIKYYWRLRSQNILFESAWSEVYSFLF